MLCLLNQFTFYKFLTVFLCSLKKGSKIESVKVKGKQAWKSLRAANVWNFSIAFARAHRLSPNKNCNKSTSRIQCMRLGPYNSEASVPGVQTDHFFMPNLRHFFTRFITFSELKHFCCRIFFLTYTLKYTTCTLRYGIFWILWYDSEYFEKSV